MPTIMPKVNRSRFSWMNSLSRMPSQREKEKEYPFIASPPLKLILAALHEVNEGILQRGRNEGHLQVGALKSRIQTGFQGSLVLSANVQRGTEAGHQIDTGQQAQTFAQALQALAADFAGMQLLT